MQVVEADREFVKYYFEIPDEDFSMEVRLHLHALPVLSVLLADWLLRMHPRGCFVSYWTANERRTNNFQIMKLPSESTWNLEVIFARPYPLPLLRADAVFRRSQVHFQQR